MKLAIVVILALAVAVMATQDTRHHRLTRLTRAQMKAHATSGAKPVLEGTWACKDKDLGATAWALTGDAFDSWSSYDSGMGTKCKEMDGASSTYWGKVFAAIKEEAGNVAEDFCHFFHVHVYKNAGGDFFVIGHTAEYIKMKPEEVASCKKALTGTDAALCDAAANGRQAEGERTKTGAGQTFGQRSGTQCNTLPAGMTKHLVVFSSADKKVCSFASVEDMVKQLKPLATDNTKKQILAGGGCYLDLTVASSDQANWSGNYLGSINKNGGKYHFCGPNKNLGL